MTPQQFIRNWQDNPLKERASYQLHFIDLCALIDVPHPSPSSHETYCFERGATRTGAGQGWADVWKQGHFAFEYKATRRNLGEALKQLMTYALALDNPPLLVVCDTSIIEIHTHFTNAPSEVHTIALQDIGEPANLDKLRWLFTDPGKFHPQRTIAQITEEAAGKFADLAQSLNSRGHAPQQVAHFLNQCLFCLFAEDAKLLPAKLFERLIDKSQTDPAKLSTRLEALFTSMQKGGDFGADDIAWFNGGLFETVAVLPLTASETTMLHAAATLDWSGIEPSIFGTLFERGLDPKKRAQLGAHYTDQQSIMRIINPVVVEPLTAEWQAAKQVIAGRMALYEKGGKGSKHALQEAQGAFITYLERLKNFKVLDPACGSGNFLYLALRALKDLEHKANLEAEQFGLHRQVSIEVSPDNVLGIEVNPYAAELARVTVWIGEIQWMLKNGYPIRKNPILQALDHIENRDALLFSPSPQPSPARGEGVTPLSLDGRGAGREGEAVEAEWPAVDAIIGNPPFLGGSKMRGELGDTYFEGLNRVYKGRVPGGADLVTYWFEKARAHIQQGKAKAAGLVATNSIRGGANRKVLERILASARIFNAWSDEPWVNNGAAVRVSLVCFGTASPSTSRGGVGKVGDIEPCKTLPSAKLPLPEETKEFARALRKHATDVENLLWQLLRKNQVLGYGFRRQHPLGPYFLDFYCHQAKLAIELDGEQHAEPGQQAHDAKRSAWLTTQGITVLRFWNNEVLENTDGVLQSVFDWLTSFSPTPTPPPKVEGLSAMLDGQPVAAIHADLTATPLNHSGTAMDLTQAKPLRENLGVSFQGTKKGSAFDISGELARQWLRLPNPHGLPNCNVLKPWVNGMDITRRPSDTWIIDFGTTMSEAEAMLYEAPFKYVLEHVKPEREKSRTESLRILWWKHERPRQEMMELLVSLPRYIGTARVAKHRLFVWLNSSVVPDSQIIVIARTDDATFGILHSRFHELWALRLGTSLEDRPRYTPTTTFETFPFPVGPTTPSLALPPAGEGSPSPSTSGGGVGVGENIATTARKLTELRENWLNPPEWTDWLRTPEEEKAGYPLRPVAKAGHEADLKKRTLTNLYNARPAWLDNAHKTLDAAVAQAYGWNDYTPEMPDEEILRRLLALNLARAG